MIAIIIGLLLPGVAVALYFGIAIYLVVPFREVARLLFQRSSSRPVEPHNLVHTHVDQAACLDAITKLNKLLGGTE